MKSTDAFLSARKQLLAWREDHSIARRDFRWPRLENFNWAIDYFDVIAAGNEAAALRVVDDAGGDRCLSYAELSRRSSQVANFFRQQGIGPGDRILLMLGNIVPLWEIMLGAIKARAIIVPATTLL